MSYCKKISLHSCLSVSLASSVVKFPQASSKCMYVCCNVFGFISGGCGAMYEIHIESDEFRGKRTVQQHQLVNQALKDEIKAMHGLRIFTDVPRK
uniref:BolA family member 3 n=1 Tax=Sinocyclocheilus grahami TaxID=75366 RepID=A0A672RTF4_SINGR